MHSLPPTRGLVILPLPFPSSLPSTRSEPGEFGGGRRRHSVILGSASGEKAAVDGEQVFDAEAVLVLIFLIMLSTFWPAILAQRCIMGRSTSSAYVVTQLLRSNEHTMKTVGDSQASTV
jgi:hypothetical protein